MKLLAKRNKYERAKTRKNALIRYLLYYTSIKYLIDDGIKLYDEPITKIPVWFTYVNGFFYLFKMKITTLPNNFYVNGPLFIYLGDLEDLPPNITINGDLRCFRCPLSRKYTNDSLKEKYPNIKGKIELKHNFFGFTYQLVIFFFKYFH